MDEREALLSEDFLTAICKKQVKRDLRKVLKYYFL